MNNNNVLSTFDGLSGGQIALTKLGIQYNKYYASEIDKPAIKVAQYNFPNTIQLGDVRNIDGTVLQDIKLLMGGSPCQSFSFMGKRKGMTTNENVEITDLETYLSMKSNGFEFQGQSYLFWEFVRLLKETKAKYFLLENVVMSSKWEHVITRALGVEPIKINSARVSAQNRERIYWTNIPNITIPEDKGIMLTDVIPGAVAAGKRGRKLKGDNHYSYPLTTRTDGKSNCIVTATSNTGFYIKDGEYLPYTPEQAEVLQTLDKGYTDVPGVSKTNRLHMIGNGWTIDVIQHLFTGLISKKNKYQLYFR